MEYLISAFLSWSLSMACTCTIDVPTAAVSNTRPSNEDDRNSGLKRETGIQCDFYVKFETRANNQTQYKTTVLLVS